MKDLRRIAVLTAWLTVFAALAIEPPQPAPGSPAKPEPPTAEPTPEPAPESGPVTESAPAAEPGAEEDELPPLPPEAAPAGPPPQRFNPTEKVRADFPVSFPIDI